MKQVIRSVGALVCAGFVFLCVVVLSGCASVEKCKNRPPVCLCMMVGESGMVVNPDADCPDCEVCTIWSDSYKPCSKSVAECPAWSVMSLDVCPLCDSCKQNIMTMAAKNAMCGDSNMKMPMAMDKDGKPMPMAMDKDGKPMPMAMDKDGKPMPMAMDKDGKKMSMGSEMKCTSSCGKTMKQKRVRDLTTPAMIEANKQCRRCPQVAESAAQTKRIAKARICTTECFPDKGCICNRACHCENCGTPACTCENCPCSETLVMEIQETVVTPVPSAPLVPMSASATENARFGSPTLLPPANPVPASAVPPVMPTVPNPAAMP